MKILDVGCGPGIYVQALRDAGVKAFGVDIDPLSPFDKVDIFSEGFRSAYAGNYDVCLSLEVAEHLPEDKAEAFVECLTSVAPVVVFSAAMPGQGGHGHINCQPKSYWIELFAQLNYVVDDVATDDLVSFMRNGYHLGWLTQNVVVFKSYGAACYKRIIEEETPQAKRLSEWFTTTNTLKND